LAQALILEEAEVGVVEIFRIQIRELDAVKQ
jgi:hypothetical protein